MHVILEKIGNTPFHKSMILNNNSSSNTLTGVMAYYWTYWINEILTTILPSLRACLITPDNMLSSFKLTKCGIFFSFSPASPSLPAVSLREACS